MWVDILDILANFGKVSVGSATVLSAYFSFLMLQKMRGAKVNWRFKIRRSKASGGSKRSSSELTVFCTINQKTILKAGNNGIECYLHDSRPQKTSGLQWVLAAYEIERIIKRDEVTVSEGLKPKCGTFSIGPHRDWLYSKSLYPSASELQEKLRHLIESARSGC